MKKLFTLLLCSFCIAAYSQDSGKLIKPLDLVEHQKETLGKFKNFEPFQEATTEKSVGFDLEEGIEQYKILDLKEASLRQLKNLSLETIELELPGIVSKETLALQLVKVELFTTDSDIILASTRTKAMVDPGVHYRGIVKGDNKSLVAVSIFNDEIRGLISTKAGNLVLGKLKGNAKNGEHIIYDDREVLKKLPFDCGTMDDGVIYKPNDLQYTPNKSPGDCIRFYIEVDNDIYNNKGGASGTTNYITGLLNEVSTLYSNESIPTVVSQLVLWDVTSPYSSTSSSGMLSDFQSNLGSFNGDLAQLFSYQASGGIAAGFAGICNANPDNSMCFSSIGSTYAVVPTYSWSVMVATHEFGHLFGSRHTHACVWNGNGTAIDGCAGSTEGTCALPGYPSNGGTLMSYCHLQSVGINFNEGFGTQPGNVIRNEVDNASCTSACGPPSCSDGIQNQDETGVDCGGTICAPCPTCTDGIQNGDELGVDCGGSQCAACPCTGQDVTLTIVLDNYPAETTWSITSGGLTYASGGPYSTAGATEVEVNCLNDACYDFNIFDSYGDGICCTYGNGSYLLEDASGNTLASGGSFGSSETTNFCLTSTPSVTVTIASQTDVS
ncbi:MAG: zinc-dependent metalloprotease [Bacteroidia bacterium]|nr:zinc-dependent metalloprotease [Bacteroidia bacterium]